jgi:predicted Rossmann-fold nucleotide-binding protein
LSVVEFSRAGGYGTLEELMEIITWSQLRIHAKPVSLQSFFLALLYTNDNYEPILHIAV